MSAVTEILSDYLVYNPNTPESDYVDEIHRLSDIHKCAIVAAVDADANSTDRIVDAFIQAPEADLSILSEALALPENDDKKHELWNLMRRQLADQINWCGIESHIDRWLEAQEEDRLIMRGEQAMYAAGHYKI